MPKAVHFFRLKNSVAKYATKFITTYIKKIKWSYIESLFFIFSLHTI